MPATKLKSAAAQDRDDLKAARDEPQEDFTGLVNASLFEAENVPRGMIDPEARFRVTWDMLMLALLLYVSVASPMEIASGRIRRYRWSTSCDILFIASIVLNFRAGYIAGGARQDADPHSTVPTRLVHPRRRLLLPGAGVDLDQPASADLLGLKLVRLLKLGRLSRVNRIKILRDMQYNGAIRPGVVRFVKLMSMYLYIVHITACRSPRCRQRGRPSSAVCDELSFGEQYTHALYWTSVVFMGNDSFPGTQTRKLFSLGVLLIGMMVNAVVIGSCASLLANLDSQALMKQQLFDSINEHLAYHKVSKDFGPPRPEYVNGRAATRPRTICSSASCRTR